MTHIPRKTSKSLVSMIFRRALSHQHRVGGGLRKQKKTGQAGQPWRGLEVLLPLWPVLKKRSHHIASHSRSFLWSGPSKHGSHLTLHSTKWAEKSHKHDMRRLNLSHHHVDRIATHHMIVICGIGIYSKLSSSLASLSRWRWWWLAMYDIPATSHPWARRQPATRQITSSNSPYHAIPVKVLYFK